MGKGEIARYEQFLLFPQGFQKACFPEASKGVIVWEWVKVVDFVKFQVIYVKPQKRIAPQQNGFFENSRAGSSYTL